MAVVRIASLDDAESLLQHVREVAAEEIYLQIERVDRTVLEERDWIQKFDSMNSLLLVAACNNRIVGSADFHRGRQPKSSHVVELGMAVRRDARRQGLGRAMLREGVEWARSEGVQKLSLQVFATNQPAIGLYRSLGFEVEGRLRGHVVLRGNPDDLLLMSLWL